MLSLNRFRRQTQRILSARERKCLERWLMDSRPLAHGNFKKSPNGIQHPHSVFFRRARKRNLSYPPASRPRLQRPAKFAHLVPTPGIADTTPAPRPSHDEARSSSAGRRKTFPSPRCTARLEGWSEESDTRQADLPQLLRAPPTAANAAAAARLSSSVQSLFDVLY
ncbi:hypothetical protein C8R44DRAFT_737240 [Mycena epipterygia]|nr:hypothetical protein C8R44DRAFT_737240 [Mycena epipterygia]